MRLVIQSVEKATLYVDHTMKASILHGAIVYVGFHESDDEVIVRHMVEKLLNLRIYPDAFGKTNLSLKDYQGTLLLVPNFTLYGDVSGSRRPSFSHALRPDLAERLFQFMIDLTKKEEPTTQHGVFGANMHIEVAHQGPFTMVIES